MRLQDFFQAGNLKFDKTAIAADKELSRHIQQVLIGLKLLNPPADGKFGILSTDALLRFQSTMATKLPILRDEMGYLARYTAKALIETSLDELPQPRIDLSRQDLAAKIVDYMLNKKYTVFNGAGELNIVYVEGMSPNGTLNSDRPNEFNDTRLVIEINPDGRPIILGAWQATTEPGNLYTNKPLNPKGAARIAFGQYKAWRVGQHCGASGSCHEALVQVAKITIHRDANKDHSRKGDKLFAGLYGINQHWGFDHAYNNIGAASAGCLVGRSTSEHKSFMTIVKRDRRYKLNKNYIFYTAILDGSDFLS